MLTLHLQFKLIFPQQVFFSHTINFQGGEIQFWMFQHYLNVSFHVRRKTISPDKEAKLRQIHLVTHE